MSLSSSSPCLCDAHAHFFSITDLKERQRDRIFTLIHVGTPKEANQLLSLCPSLCPTTPSSSFVPPFFSLSCGLHPWNADQLSFSELLPFLRQAPVIGEIGMDSVWCQVPLSLQETQFRRQLAFACGEKKPVILHTKGQEKRIASIIKEYRNQYLVHWYSSNEPPNAYLELDCYFSIGPDVFWNPAVQQLAGLVPENRLLLETDGLSAVQWAYECAPLSEQKRLYSICNSPMQKTAVTAHQALLFSLQTLAELRGTSPEPLSQRIAENLQRFLVSGCSGFDHSCY